MLKKQRTDIQILRGLAVSGVVLFHANEELFRNGLLGVDVFFAISGFVVAPLVIEIFDSISRKEFVRTLCTFLRNRYFRLAPALFVMLIATSIVIIIFSSISDLGRISKQGLYTIFMLGNLGAYKFAGDYFAPAPNPLIHTWSLGVEEQFYLFIPLCVGLFCKAFVKVQRHIHTLLFPLLIAISFLLFLKPELLQTTYAKFGISEPLWAAFYFPTSRAWEFLAGYLTCVLVNRFSSTKRNSKVFQLGRIWMLVTLLVIPLKVDSNFLAPIIVIVTCLILKNRDLEYVQYEFRKRLVWIGDRSYSIYLFHMPLLYIPITSPLYAEFGLPRAIGILLSLLATFVVADVVYKRVENKFRIRRVVDEKFESELKKKAGQILILGIISSVIFSTLIFGDSNKYWGLDRNIEIPQYAGFLDPNCERDTRNGPPCRYGFNATAKTILLVGDSHAGHFSQAVVYAAKISHWNSVIWTHSSCRFELYSGVPDWCKTVNFGIVDFIRRTSPDLVVLSQSNSLNPDVSSTIKSITFLAKVSRDLVIVDETPRFTDSKFMNSGTLFQKPYDPPKYIQMQIAREKYVLNANKIFSADALSEVTVLNVNDNFCTATKCFRWKYGKWLYRDSNHLSVAGARLVQSDFTKLLKTFS